MRKFGLAAVTCLAIAPATATALTPTQAWLINAATEGESGAVIPIATTATGPDRCHSGVKHEKWWAVAGIHVAGIRTYQYGWCYRSNRITRDFGWHFSVWASGPYCITNVDHLGPSWLIYPSWKHGQSSGTLGVDTVFGCIGSWKHGASSIRISSWNGYYDWRYQ